jgi:Cu2+-containing amine oxidase
LQGWCNIPVEGLMVRESHLNQKWRVVDPEDKNSQGNAKSYEYVIYQSDHPPYTFSTFDTMVAQYKGDSQELGYEVPAMPPEVAGDRALHDYITPPEVIDDPVAWVVLHIYHDTRDEERRSMPYHWAQFGIRPNNFLSENPGEPTFWSQHGH